LARNVKQSYMKKTCPRCKAQVSVRAARCRHCRYSFPEKSSPWAAGPALGVGFPLVLMGVLTLLLAGRSTGLVILAAAMVLVGGLLFFHPR
jgi:ribosomal protein L40E